MKVILNHSTPFALASGGVTNIVLKTKEVLESEGVEVECLRWWDTEQKGDILFHFGRPSINLVRFAKSSGYRVVAEHVMTGLVSRPLAKRKIQKLVIKGARSILPQVVSDIFSWDSFMMMDMNFFPSEWDQSVAEHMFGLSHEKSRVLPYGVNAPFLNLEEPEKRDDYLVCTATITPRKRILELAQACHVAQVPIKIIGKPYAQSDAYYEKFKDLEATSDYVEHVQHVSDQNKLAQIYLNARGFVLVSKMETISQSAIEASACRTPLLLSDMDWAHRAFGDNASYCPVTKDTDLTATTIRQFYQTAADLKPEWTPPTWYEARKGIVNVFEEILSRPDTFKLDAKHI